MMLSYQWDMQELAIRIFVWLMDHGICVWMDIMYVRHLLLSRQDTHQLFFSSFSLL
jgi:hypothetical protein